MGRSRANSRSKMMLTDRLCRSGWVALLMKRIRKGESINSRHTRRAAMKRLAILAIVALLFSGCAPVGIKPNEGLVPDHAYVVGQKVHTNGNSFYFSHIDRKPMMGEWDTDFYLPNVDNDHTYYVRKVKPGRYIFEYIVQPTGYSRSVTKLGSVLLEAGKINYIGTINVEHHNVTSTWSETRFKLSPPTVTYQPEVVKEIIRKQYPGLAPDINSKFVIQQLR